MRHDWNHIIEPDWTLMLDRDGVINRQIVGGYVTHWEEFEFLPGVFEAFQKFTQRFKYIFVVTNQQGVDKGLMTIEDLEAIHDRMCSEIECHGGRIDGLFVCTQLASAPDNYRKPDPRMAFTAQRLHPDLDLAKCIMVGDKDTDVDFGHNAGTHTIFLGPENPNADDSFGSLYEFSQLL